MAEMQLAFGSDKVNLVFAADRFEILTSDKSSRQPLTDFEIGLAFDHPIESKSLEELLSPGDSVLIVASDATRASASAQIINLLVRRIIQQGVSPAAVTIIFATGIHRPTTLAEKEGLLTPFITQRIRVLDHDAFDEKKLVVLGETKSGTPIEVNRILTEVTHVILTGGIGFHYFAGFTGGRKSVCPGLASARTIAATHMLALDFENGGRRLGVVTGGLEGNAVHEECERIASLVAPAFGVNAIVDENGRATQVFAGHWRAAHHAACGQYRTDHSIRIAEKRPLVIASCGGYPFDINLIQAHKTLNMAASACQDGGTIILLAECRDGLGRSDFLKWFDSENSAALENRLRENYEVNGQTAWSLLTKAEKFKVILISKLDEGDIARMRMTPATSLNEALTIAGSAACGFIMPRGAALLPIAPA
jgi:nickel-dependent lactate racemase